MRIADNLSSTYAKQLVTRAPMLTDDRPAVEGKGFVHQGHKLPIQGVTYGPFSPGRDRSPFPSISQTRADFTHMRDVGVNSIRAYHVPPSWLLELADEAGLLVLIDVPWSKHVCFLESRRAQAEARQSVRRAAELGRFHASILAYSIANEIPPDIVRWHGASRIERFLSELRDVCKQADPKGMVTYANYPPTEYLSLPFLDFATFNVYLHDLETFRRYLFRLHNLIGDMPLVLGELGMDSIRHGENEQAGFLAGHVREAFLMGLAGSFVFSWTDDWHTGGYDVRDWAFGLTTVDRAAKPACHALREVYESSRPALLANTPRVSIVVCSYNGVRTLQQCLQSLMTLNYPNYEVILVDDGSTDNTREIVARFPRVRAIHQSNQGLSAARNVGLQAATGSIVAYTDSDCFADEDWLTHLVHQFQRCDAAAVGGPNLTPEDGRLAACVAASPGQPTHVLESDQVAEHIPGCNMAFRREALLAINGFDVQFCKAGDDVDVCWRLQQAGSWIAFAPGAFVWHQRRQTPRDYLRQQAGYGEAEALLRFKHPDKFNGRGDGKWRGVMYGASLHGLRLSQPIIYRGTFGTGLFQCLYQPGPAHWAMLPATLEWHVAIIVLFLAAVFWPILGAAALSMLGLSFMVAFLQTVQARLAPQYYGLLSRVIIAGLCYAQPLVRSWARYKTRLFFFRVGTREPAPVDGGSDRAPLFGFSTRSYWTEGASDRIELLQQVRHYLEERRWGKTMELPWSSDDLQIYCHPWTMLYVRTVQEEHGQGKRLVCIGYRVRATRIVHLIVALWIVAIPIVATTQPLMAAILAVLLIAMLGRAWWRGNRLASQAVHVFDDFADRLGFVRCQAPAKEKHTYVLEAHSATS